MSKPRYRWWTFAKNMIRDFPAVEKEWKDIHAQSITANMSGMPRSGGAGRTVETVALRQLKPEDQKLYDAVTGAKEHTILLPNGTDRMKLIRLMYWSGKPRTVQAVAKQIPVSEVTAKRWHGDFVRLVGVHYGFKDDTYEPK